MDNNRTYMDGVVSAAESLDNTWPDMPPGSYTIMLTIDTVDRGTVPVYLEVSTRPGRSEYTKDRCYWELTLAALQRIDPAADLCNPAALVGKPCRLLERIDDVGKCHYYLVARQDSATALASTPRLTPDELCARLMQMRQRRAEAPVSF